MRTLISCSEGGSTDGNVPPAKDADLSHQHAGVPSGTSFLPEERDKRCLCAFAVRLPRSDRVVKRRRNAYNILMEFLREIANILGAGDALSIHYTVVDGSGGYFQNVVRLLSFSETEIVLKGRRSNVRVEGERLSLGKYFAGDLVIRGNIVRIGREDGHAKL